MEAVAPVPRIRPLTSAFYCSICEILDVSGQVVKGTGMIIDPMRVLTCAHVAALALGIADQRSLEAGRQHALKIRRSYVPAEEPVPVWLEFYRSRYAPADDKLADLAVLRRGEGQFAAGEESPDLLPDFSEVLDYGERIIATGFPSDKAGARSRLDDASYVVGVRAPSGWFNVHVEDGSDAVIRGGYSGGPVWSKDQGAVVGISSEANEARGTAAVIPVGHFLKIPVLDIQPVPPAPPPAAVPIATIELGRPSPVRQILEWTVPNVHRWLTISLSAMSTPVERRVLVDEMSNLVARLSGEIGRATYLPPIAREPESDAVVGFQPLRQLIRAIGQGYQGGGDAASAELSAMSRRSRPIRRLVDVLRRSDDAVILLGDPGSGKSLTLQQTALSIAEINRWRVYPNVCIFVRLGRWTPSQGAGSPSISDVEQLVLEQAPPALQPYIDALARAGRLIVIFDGMDEMSRQRYIEHTSALSQYAIKYHRQVRCLFSCRISDFAPTFPHRRMVLLPFDRAHVVTYLQRQLGRGRVALGDRQESVDRLAGMLLDASFPVQANNPYMLYLLSLYVRDKHDLPTRRIDVLKYFFVSSIERETKDEPGVRLDLDLVFGMLGKLALEITTRNAGTEINRLEIDASLGKLAGPVVKLACDAGILVQALNEDERLPPAIRFSNHRAQEFFTAYALTRSTDSFDWAGKLDIPRWQETLVNLAQFGSDLGGISELARTLDAAVADAEAAVAPASRSFAEADASERVYLAARVARDLEPTPQRDALVASVTAATNFLAGSSDAVSRAATLRIAHQLPEVGGPVLRSLLHDTSPWVRDQARLIEMEITGGSPQQLIADGIVADYLSNQTIFRISTYATMAKKMHSRGTAVAAAIAVACFLAQLFVMTAFGPALGWAIHTHAEIVAAAGPRGTAADMVVAHQTWAAAGALWPWLIGLQVAVSVSALIVVLGRRMEEGWIILLGSGLATNALPFWVLAAWFGARYATLGGIVGFAVTTGVVVVVANAILPIASAVVSSACATPLGIALALWTRSPSPLLRLLSKVRERFPSFGAIGGTLRYAVGIGVVVVALYFLAPHLNRVLELAMYLVIRFPMMPFTVDVLASIGLWIAVVGALIVTVRRYRGSTTWARELTSVVLFAIAPAGIYIGLAVLGLLFWGLGQLLAGLDGMWQYIAYFAVAIVSVAVISLAGYMGIQMLHVLYHLVRSRLRQLTENFGPEELRRSFRAADAAVQPLVIRPVTPERLHLSVDATIELLIELEQDAKTDAARDALNSKRAKLLSLRRHERYDSESRSPSR